MSRALATEGKTELGAAHSVWSYAESLPDRYRQEWDTMGIVSQANVVAIRTQVSFRAKLSGHPERYAEDAVRREYGAAARASADPGAGN